MVMKGLAAKEIFSSGIIIGKTQGSYVSFLTMASMLKDVNMTNIREYFPEAQKFGAVMYLGGWGSLDSANVDRSEAKNSKFVSIKQLGEIEDIKVFDPLSF